MKVSVVVKLETCAYFVCYAKKLQQLWLSMRLYFQVHLKNFDGTQYSAKFVESLEEDERPGSSNSVE